MARLAGSAGKLGLAGQLVAWWPAGWLAGCADLCYDSELMNRNTDKNRTATLPVNIAPVLVIPEIKIRDCMALHCMRLYGKLVVDHRDQ